MVNKNAPNVENKKELSPPTLPLQKVRKVYLIIKLVQPCSLYLKSSNPIRLPGLVSESVLLWDKIRIHIYKLKHGKIVLSS